MNEKQRGGRPIAAPRLGLIPWSLVCVWWLLAVVAADFSAASAWGQSRADSTILRQPGSADGARGDSGAAVDAGTGTGTGAGAGADEPAIRTGDEALAAPQVWRAAHVHSLLTLAIGVLIVLIGIIGFKMNAFLALIVAALVVSLMSQGAWTDKVTRVGAEFGASAGRLGLVIALAAVIGQSFLASGCAERVVGFFVSCLGEKRMPTALCGSSFVLGIPVFFDTVFYLMVPLARSAFLRTRSRYLACLLAVVAGGVATHTLVPPTPGPLLVGANLGVDLGTLLVVGSCIGVVAAMAGMVFGFFADRWMTIPVRWLDDPNTESEAKHTHAAQSLPSLGLAVLPLGLPVALIAGATILTTWADQEGQAKFQVERPADWRGLQAVMVAPTPLNAELWSRSVSVERPSAEASLTESPAAEPGLAAAATPSVSGVSGVVGAVVPEFVVEPQTLLSAQRVLPRLVGLLAQAESPEVQALSASSSDAEYVASLNRLLARRDLYDESVFLGVRFSAATRKLLSESRQRLPVAQVERLNRLLLEDTFPGLVGPHVWETPMRQVATWSSIFGDANLALLIAAVLALWIEKRQRRIGWAVLGGEVEKALASAGVIILITAAGGAFGAMLNVAQVGETIREVFSQYSRSGLSLIVLAFAISSLLKIAQGSSTVAMITASGMLASVANPEVLGCHPVYMATAIGGGSLFGSWMNDSGFWIFAKMGYLTTEEALRTWTPCLAVVGFTAGVMSVLLAWLLPMVG